VSETFARCAGRLAGAAGLWFGWSPDQFWRATPAEFAALLIAARGEEAQPADSVLIARMMEADPDG